MIGGRGKGWIDRSMHSVSRLPLVPLPPNSCLLVPLPTCHWFCAYAGTIRVTFIEENGGRALTYDLTEFQTIVVPTGWLRVGLAHALKHMLVEGGTSGWLRVGLLIG